LSNIKNKSEIVCENCTFMIPHTIYNSFQAPEISIAENRPQSNSDDSSSCGRIEAGTEEQSSSAQQVNPKNVSVFIFSKDN